MTLALLAVNFKTVLSLCLLNLRSSSIDSVTIFTVIVSDLSTLNWFLLPGVHNGASTELIIQAECRDSAYVSIPRQDAVKGSIEFKNQFTRGTVYADSCRSWYKSNQVEGSVTTLYPGSTLNYIKAIDAVRLDDWDVQSNDNRFSWIRNGYSHDQSSKTAD